MKLSKRGAALALALASCATYAHAADIYYEIDFTVTSASSAPPGTVWRGWFVTDDALATSGGSGTIASYEFEMFNGPVAFPYGPFGTRNGNDRAIPTGFAGGYYILHSPGFGGSVEFTNGVPTSFGYGEQHVYSLTGPFVGSSYFEVDPTSILPNAGFDWLMQFGAGGADGTYAISGPIPAVPEPETWVLLLVGVAALRAAVRRQQA